MTTSEERLSRLEGEVAQLATKPELAEKLAKLRVEAAQREARLVAWIGMVVLSLTVIFSITLAAVVLLGR